MGDWKLPAKECLSPWGTSKANGIEPIRLTVSSMSCDLSMVIAYYDDKWTHLSNWSLSTHFSSFLESWGHYLSTSDRQQWQPQEQRACMTRHRWLFYSDEYIYSYFQGNGNSCMLSVHTWNIYQMMFPLLRRRTTSWLYHHSEITRFCFFPLPGFLFAVFSVWIPYSCWSPGGVKYRNKNTFFRWRCL